MDINPPPGPPLNTVGHRPPPPMGEIENKIQNVDEKEINSLPSKEKKIISAIKLAYEKQIETLTMAIEEERIQSAAAQVVYEQTLKTRYEAMVDSLQLKIKSEQQSQIQRALDNIERSAKLESERAREMITLQKEIEQTVAKKFDGLVTELRASWEEEEIGRAVQLEDRLRNHYCTVLEHMEAQLKMALKLQDDADKQWMDDVEKRNIQQVEAMKAFESKCKRLYETRLQDYIQKSSSQFESYEQKLLDNSSKMAVERAEFESRLRRLKMSCTRWKLSYQKESIAKYDAINAALEERYIVEMSKLLGSNTTLGHKMNELTASLEEKDSEITLLKRKLNSLGATDSLNLERMTVDGIDPQVEELLSTLHSQWAEYNVSKDEQVNVLTHLLRETRATMTMLNRFDQLQSKFSDKIPIYNAYNRVEFLENKMQMASRVMGEGKMSVSERNQVTAELKDLAAAINEAVISFENKYREPFHWESARGNERSKMKHTKTANLGNSRRQNNSSSTALIKSQNMKVRRI